MLPSDDGHIMKRLVAILKNTDHGQAIQQDLHSGLSALPDWMRVIVRDLLQQANEKGKAKAPLRAVTGAQALARRAGIS
jgi:hypothetical protein